MKKHSYVTFSMEVTKEERASALKIRKSFEEVLVKQDKFLEFLSVFFESLEVLPTAEDLYKISHLVKRYEFKLKSIFNDFIDIFGKSLTLYSDHFNDLEMDSMRELLVQHVKDLREQVIILIKLLQDLTAKDFREDSLKIYKAVKSTGLKFVNVVKHEWFDHIDYDILGKIKLT